MLTEGVGVTAVTRLVVAAFQFCEDNLYCRIYSFVVPDDGGFQVASTEVKDVLVIERLLGEPSEGLAIFPQI